MSNFTFTPTALEGVVIVETRSFGDDRGAFMETYHAREFAAAGIDAVFVQDNQASSQRGVLRGLHFQLEHPQAKLVRVIAGTVVDVAADIRPESPSYGKWVAVELSAENHRQLYIPRGLAHGYYVTSERTTFAYKCDEFYHPEDEGGVAWDDPTLAIAWPLIAGTEPILSEKDRCWPSLEALKLC